MFVGRIKNLQAKSEIAAVRSAGFNKFPCRSEMFIYFLASCAECTFTVGLSLLHKEVSGICVCCVWLS